MVREQATVDSSKQCNGERPSCGNCSRLQVRCDYGNIQLNETRASANRKQTASQSSQLEELRAGLHVLKYMPAADVASWMKQIQSAEDPLSALQSLIRQPPNNLRLPPSIPDSSSMQAMGPGSSPASLRLSTNHPLAYAPIPLDLLSNNNEALTEFARKAVVLPSGTKAI